MGLPKYRAKNDANHKEIVTALQAIGCTVWQLGRPLDLLVGFRGKNVLLEIKNPDGRNRVEPDQQQFINEWRGQSAVVRSVGEAIDVCVRVGAR